MALALLGASGGAMPSALTGPTSAGTRVRRLFPVVIVAVWLPIVGAGLIALWDYSTAPGAAGNPPVNWPATSHIPRSPSSMNLVMVVHPHCPCSRASIGELAVLMAHAQERARAWVIFVRPPGFDSSWAETDLWRSAKSIPGVTAVFDDGREAREFGAETSGETLLYDGKGHLVFAGGVTGARGHFGDNAGLQAVLDRVEDPQAHRAASAAVYGCPLFAPSTNGKTSCKR